MYVCVMRVAFALNVYATALTQDVERHLAALFGAADCLAVVAFPFDQSQIDSIIASLELFAPKHTFETRVRCV